MYGLFYGRKDDGQKPCGWKDAGQKLVDDKKKSETELTAGVKREKKVKSTQKVK